MIDNSKRSEGIMWVDCASHSSYALALLSLILHVQKLFPKNKTSLTQAEHSRTEREKLRCEGDCSINSDCLSLRYLSHIDSGDKTLTCNFNYIN